MAAFLYRMAGQPTFTPPAKPSFSDVSANSDYFVGIEWLKATGITTGTSATTFSPTAGVTRQQMAAFLYRMAGQPPFTPPSKPTFSDVPANSDYFVSIEWLKTTGVTTGTSATTFSPTAIVTRQQMAAFLYRMSTTKLGCTPYPARVGCVLMTGSTPTISGTKTVGSTLTVSVGTWTPSGTTTSIQWFRNGVAISGATRTTYVIVAADGGTSLTVSVTGTKAGFSPVTKTSAAAAIPGAAFVTAPTPTISGTATVGSTLTVTPGTWTPAATFTYQWFRDGVAISGATSNKYVLVAADAGHKMTVTVTGSKAGYTTTSKTSAATAAVAAAPLKAFTTAPTPTISGTAAVGLTLTVAPGTWSPAVLSFSLSYQWLRDGVAITGATSKTYVLVAADAGHKITVTVTGSAPGYATTSRTSAATAAVAPLKTDVVPDPAFRACLNGYVGQAGSAPINSAQLYSLTRATYDSVGCKSAGISSLEGAQYLTGLRALTLSYNQISDVSPLAGLTNLTFLDLGWNKINNVSSLAGLTNLTYLYLDSNQISNVSPLAGLTNLTGLSLNSNQITNVSPLAGLTKLTRLSLNSNQITNVSPLAGLTSLFNLYLNSNQISNVSPLAGLPYLNTLYISSNKISDVSSLAGLTNMVLLDLSSNQISNLSPLAGMTKLTNLFLASNQISNVSPLAGLINLTSLSLSFNQISNVSPLAGLTKLSWLELSFNQISDVSPLKGLTNMKSLYLRGNPVCNTSPSVCS